MRSTYAVFVAAVIGFGVSVVGCRALEQAGGDLDKGLHDTQNDMQRGIRGEPENSAPPASASTAQPRPTAPQSVPAGPTPPAPPPAPANSGVSL